MSVQTHANPIDSIRRSDSTRSCGPLLVVPALRAGIGERGGFILTRKFVEGAREYARLWPGEVIVAVRPAIGRDTNLDHQVVYSREVPFTIERLPDDSNAVAQRVRQSAIVLGSLVDENLFLAELCKSMDTPLVFVAEYSLRTREQIIHTETRNPLKRWRRKLWTRRLEGRIHDALRLADGVQCNGTPTFDAYQRLNRHALLYFDTRVRANQVVSNDDLESRFGILLNGAALRLAFSGRLIAMKGVEYLPAVAGELRRLKVPFTFDVCGDGPLESRLRRDIASRGLVSQMRLRGVLDFESELLPYMSNSIDLFVCCHPQGDPSCTYLETMSCGVPIIGFDNEAFRGIVDRSRAGWLTPLGDPRALARQIAQLSHERHRLVDAALRARQFAAQHLFESTMRLRIDHLTECAGISSAPAGGRS